MRKRIREKINNISNTELEKNLMINTKKQNRDKTRNNIRELCNV